MRAVLLAVLLSLAACDRGDPAAEGAAKAFLEQNKKEPGVKVTASGLQYKVLRAAPEGAPRPRVGDTVKVHYEGTLPDGTVFDSSFQQGVPAVFQVGDLVAGWNEVLQLMRAGDEWIVVVPPDLAYGEAGAGPIPPNSVLVFRMQLLDVLPDGGAVQRG